MILYVLVFKVTANYEVWLGGLLRDYDVDLILRVRKHKTVVTQGYFRA